VAIGTDFNLFLLENGEVYVSGEVSHHFGDVLESFEEPENLNSRMEEAGIKFVEVQCGN
jgi:hypothetical protein